MASSHSGTLQAAGDCGAGHAAAVDLGGLNFQEAKTGNSPGKGKLVADWIVTTTMLRVSGGSHSRHLIRHSSLPAELRIGTHGA